MPAYPAEPSLPEIAPNLDVPLPESPDPTLTPYRIAARDPNTGELKITTGYGARRPITPPQQGAVNMPDIGSGIAAAFQHLPVDQAIKTVEIATQYQGQRGYMRDVANGVPMAQAYAKWAPMLHPRTATGMAQAMKLNTPRVPASIVTHPETPGIQFLRNPSGAETPIVRPQRGISEGERLRLGMQAKRMMQLGSSELPSDPSYQARTNYAAKILQQVKPKDETPATPPTSGPETSVPKVGDVVKGYRFKGGNPRLKESWEKV